MVLRFSYFQSYSLYYNRYFYCTLDTSKILSLLNDNKPKTKQENKNIISNNNKKYKKDNNKHYNKNNTISSLQNISLDNNIKSNKEINNETKKRINKLSLLHNISDSSISAKILYNELKTSKLLSNEKEKENYLEYLKEKEEFKKYRKEYLYYRQEGYIPSINTYISLIRILCKLNDGDLAWQSYNEMILSSYIPPLDLYNILLKQCINDNNINRIKILYNEMILLKIKPSDEFLVIYILYLLNNKKHKQGNELLEQYYNNPSLNQIDKFIQECYKSEQIEEILFLIIFWNKTLKTPSIEILEYLIEMKNKIEKQMLEQIKK